MTKKILTFLSTLILTLSNTYGQTDNNINYKDGLMYLIAVDKNGNEVGRKPIGQKVEISYDTFFKSYYIVFYDTDGAYSYYKYEYIKKEGYIIKMTDKYKNSFFVVDSLKEDGKLSILNSGDYGEFVVWTVIENVTRKNLK
jgi:hypothetical protein